MRPVYSRRALVQLAFVFNYLIERNPAAAENVTDSIKETIARLQYLPELGRWTDEQDVRVVIEPQYLYRVFYRLDGDQVTVISILHRSQLGS